MNTYNQRNNKITHKILWEMYFNIIILHIRNKSKIMIKMHFKN